MWGWKVLIEQLLLVTLSRQKRLQFLFLGFGFRFRFRIPDSGFRLFHTPDGNGGRVFLLPRTGGTGSKVRWIRFVFLLGCFFSLYVYTKNTEKDIVVKRIIICFCPLGVGCITEHAKFRIFCLDTDVLNTALVAIHNIRCNPLPDLSENRWVVAFFFLARRIAPASMYSVLY